MCQIAISQPSFVIWISSFDISQWGVKDSNLRRHCHQIYSLTPLTARETPLGRFPYFILKYIAVSRAANVMRCDRFTYTDKRGFLQASGGT